MARQAAGCTGLFHPTSTNTDIPMTLSLSLLILTICSTWLVASRFERQKAMRLWLALAVLTTGSALAYGYMTPVGLYGLLLLALFSYLSTHLQSRRWVRWMSTVLSILLALMLAMHRWPGFFNPLVIAPQRLSADSLPFLLYANVDKAGAGLILLLLYCRRSRSLAQLYEVVRKTWWLALLTIGTVMASAMLLAIVRPDFKLPSTTWLFLLLNVFFVVIAEEAFFRGFIQERLAAWIGGSLPGAALCVIVSALLFGIAHLAGGMIYAALAGLAGLGYALVYQRSRCIEASIATHFLLNTTHFLMFSYPALS